MARVGQRYALPWYRLGPIQKFGPPDGIMTVKLDSLSGYPGQQSLMFAKYLIGFCQPLAPVEAATEGETLHGNCTSWNRGGGKIFCRANPVPICLAM